MRARALEADVHWCRVGSVLFTHAARVESAWWVLRLNDFPDHPLYSLFRDREHIEDLDDVPGNWHLSTECLVPEDRTAVLELMRGLGPFGAEHGTPCDGLYCRCDLNTDDLAARPPKTPSATQAEDGPARAHETGA